MNPNFRNYALAEVPRYTSYPTAVQFGDGVGAAEWRAWLGALGEGEPLSVYVHIPFCQQLCWYCGCHTSVPNSYERAVRYSELLVREIALVAEAAGGHGGIAHLHFGGGTPTYLHARELEAVMTAVDAAFGFRPGAEIAVETDPRTLDRELVNVLASLGVNRASLGVQDVSPEVQAKINRVQPLEQVESAIDMLRAAGIGRINLDLMYGLPGQTAEHVAASAEAACTLAADRIAVFGYAHVPWFKKHQQMIRADELPGVDERMTQAARAAQVLAGAGYVAIGIDHFARPGDDLARALADGTLRRNFQGYTSDTVETLIGLGCSSIGAARQGYGQNARDIREWSERIRAGRLPVTRGVVLSAEDRVRRAVIEQIMCFMAVDVGAVCRAHGRDEAALDAEIEEVRTLARAGLAEIEGRRVRVAEDARLLARTVASRFDAYFQPSPARHSRAV